MAEPWSFLLLLLLFIHLSTANAVTYNVVSFGAKPDGHTDSAAGFLHAWAAACAAEEPANVVVPKGRFFVSKGMFHGPCNNTDIKIFVLGSIVARAVKDRTQTWLVFRYVDGLSIHRGALDGRGSEIWGCKAAGGKEKCPNGATTLSINHCRNVLINGLTLINSQYFHISIFASEGVTVTNTKIIAPGNSPNTDGIHVGMSNRVTIATAHIKTGDDCISLGPGSTNVYIDRVTCGPGHGISIGSLAESPAEAGVRNVTVKRAVMLGTTNGFRIKSYGRASNGFVDGVSFRRAVMRNVENPIVIDQNYCSSKENCPRNVSGIRVSNVEFSNIGGTSATPVAIKLDCSPGHPCTGIKLKDVKLTYRNRRAESFCRHANVTKFGSVIPPVTCF